MHSVHGARKPIATSIRVREAEVARALRARGSEADRNLDSGSRSGVSPCTPCTGLGSKSQPHIAFAKQRAKRRIESPKGAQHGSLGRSPRYWPKKRQALKGRDNARLDSRCPFRAWRTWKRNLTRTHSGRIFISPSAARYAARRTASVAPIGKSRPLDANSHGPLLPPLRRPFAPGWPGSFE